MIAMLTTDNQSALKIKKVATVIATPPRSGMDAFCFQP
jgi:hypothetical protein